jgi:hypothetical protein
MLDRKHIKCYGCGEEGHVVRNCLRKRKISIDEMKIKGNLKNHHSIV